MMPPPPILSIPATAGVLTLTFALSSAAVPPPWDIALLTAASVLAGVALASFLASRA